MNSTASLNIFNTNNFVEAAIKNLSNYTNPIWTQGTKKLNVNRLIHDLIKYISIQKPNHKINVTECEKESTDSYLKLIGVNVYFEKLNHNQYMINQFPSSSKYMVQVSSEGLFCNCYKFVKNFGRFCKHIFYILLNNNIINNNHGSGYNAIRQACIGLNINITLNTNKSIPHFISNNIYIPINTNNDFNKRRKKENKYLTLLIPKTMKNDKKINNNKINNKKINKNQVILLGFILKMIAFILLEIQ